MNFEISCSTLCSREIDASLCALQQIFAFIWLSVAVALGFLVWTLQDKIEVGLSQHFPCHIAEDNRTARAKLTLSADD